MKNYKIIDGVEQAGAHPDAVKQGVKAHKAGKALTDCPFEQHRQPFSRSAWTEGWYSARRAKAAKA